MKILTAGMATASFIAFALSACGNDGGSASFGRGQGPSPDACGQFTSCNACTPVNGCGWCYFSDGTGACATDPDQCATSTSPFTWTWNPSGCRVAADAGIAPGIGEASANASSEGGSDAVAMPPMDSSGGG